ncbi:choline-glycine betaine transporter [Endozoicomonas sp. NE35]
MSDIALNSTAVCIDKPATPKWLEGVDLSVFMISGGALLLFAVLALYDLGLVTGWVNDAFFIATRYFGAYWQALLLLTFVIALVLAVGRTGPVVLGGAENSGNTYL